MDQDIGHRLRSIRTRLGLSQRQLARVNPGSPMPPFRRSRLAA